ncbi:nucleotide sugar dehydrogenase [Priestia koreensis]|uniref:nucleotide sugar dehydrogenase n=1 Tax=Priestia koreensis TaxID=284581 RepID=UPI003D02D358
MERLNHICIVGLGYVGLTLSAAYLSKGIKVFGVENNPTTIQKLREGYLPIHEPGLEDLITENMGHQFLVTEDIPKGCKTIVICVGTPFDHKSGEPILSYLEDAVQAVATSINEDTLVIIRSTVPVGTTENLVLPIINKHIAKPKVVFAPERTIQGQAIKELMSLPQVIGTDNERHFDEASEVFRQLGVETVRVNSFAAAELVKLMNNAHTDVLYSFGNEIASIAGSLNIDAIEVIEAANYQYPRPKIAKPGYVGGSCLTKDPYHLMYSSAEYGHEPKLIKAAREVNENLPRKILETLDKTLSLEGIKWSEVTVGVSGFAYKGVPETDDLRGSSVWEIISLLQSRNVKSIIGHDFIVSNDVIEATGIMPSHNMEELIEKSDVIVVLNNHLNYKHTDIEKLVQDKEKRTIVYDMWKVLNVSKQNKNLMYMGAGFHG